MVLLIGKVTNMLATAAPQPLTYSRHSVGPENNSNFSRPIEVWYSQTEHNCFDLTSFSLKIVFPIFSSNQSVIQPKSTESLRFHIFWSFARGVMIANVIRPHFVRQRSLFDQKASKCVNS